MLIPLSLYIHIPWCLSKCPYCDFYSVPINCHNIPQEAYIEALIDDLDCDLQEFEIEKRELVSIFIGGGTPGLFSAKFIERLLNAIHKYIAFRSDIEISLEANPGAIEQKRFADFRSAGINRLSIGIQSFQDDKLRRLGRVHTASEAKKSTELVRAAGFDNFNLDLMYGLPDQSIEEAYDDLKMAIESYPTHLSWYQLTIEPGTPFGQKSPKLPNDEILWGIQTHGQDLLKNSGYQQYEISAYSRPGFRCRHNLNYWLFGDYLGIGAGSHGKITSDRYNITRYNKVKNIEDYILKKARIAETRNLLPQEKSLDFMINVLRLVDGVPVDLFKERTGLTLETVAEPLKKAQDEGFLEKNEKIIKTTTLGRNFLNNCLEIFT